MKAGRNQMITPRDQNQFFGVLGSQVVVSHSVITPRERDQFFSSVSRHMTVAETRQRRVDRRQASGLNVFDLIEPDENKLSDILAMLLDPNGGHGQGDLFLRLLFNRLGLGSDSKLTRGARVQREAPTYGIQQYRRRIDVLVDAGVLLAIENKIESMEQSDQVNDYLEHLRRIMMGHRRKSVLIYLSPDGRKPDSMSAVECRRRQAAGTLHCWSYRMDIWEWLEACKRECQAEKIRGFLSDFMAYIEVHLEREMEPSEEEEDANEG